MESFKSFFETYQRRSGEAVNRAVPDDGRTVVGIHKSRMVVPTVGCCVCEAQNPPGNNICTWCGGRQRAKVPASTSLVAI